MECILRLEMRWWRSKVQSVFERRNPRSPNSLRVFMGVLGAKLQFGERRKRQKGKEHFEGKWRAGDFHKGLSQVQADGRREWVGVADKFSLAFLWRGIAHHLNYMSLHTNHGRILPSSVGDTSHLNAAPLLIAKRKKHPWFMFSITTTEKNDCIVLFQLQFFIYAYTFTPNKYVKMWKTFLYVKCVVLVYSFFADCLFDSRKKTGDWRF